MIKMPVFLKLVIDGNSRSEIVSVLVVASEDGETMTSLVMIFKQHNPAWEENKNNTY